MEPTLLTYFLGLVLVGGTLDIWSLVLLCQTVAEVQGFRSAWRGLGNVLLAGAFILVPLLLLVIVLVLAM